jgi:hypothetical protein
MSEVRLVVREAECDWSGTIHASGADQAIAALSADPITIDELDTAMARFAKRSRRDRFLGNLSRSRCVEPYDAGLVVIDLIARLVVVDSTYSSPSHKGTTRYHDGRCATDKRLRYHLADDWLFLSDADHWQGVADARRLARAALPFRDDRAVFYGRPLLEFIARECFTAFGRRAEIAAAVRQQWTEKARNRLAKNDNIGPDQVDASRLTDEEITPRSWPGSGRSASPFYDTLKEIHAAWMLTPRADLGGDCPRTVGVARHAHLSDDMEDRCQQWSCLDECPQGIDTSAHAFRHGGFGTHELVKYYDLVRELLWSCWERLSELAEAPNVNHRPEALTVGDFLATEIPRLENVRETWLDEPDPELYGRTPRSVIDRERARLPEDACGHDLIVDPDCPCCQMIGELPGPSFWHLDGSSMDNDFAFDIYCRTREEWEEEQQAWDDYAERCDAEQSERERLGVTDSEAPAGGSPSGFSGSLTTADVCEMPLGVRLFGVGCHLAELIVGLRSGADRENTPPEAQQHINELNRDFGNLRDVLQNDDSSRADALIDPVLRRFGETLETVAADRPDLAAQCERVACDLDALLSPPGTRPDWGADEPDDPV